MEADGSGAPAMPDEKEALRVEARFLEIKANSGSDTEIRLRALYAIWRNPLGPKSLKASEEKELIRFGLVRNEIADAGEISGSTACAEFIRKVFNYPCQKQDVTHWSRGRKLPPGAKQFPLKDGAGRFKALEVEAWCKESLPDMAGKKGGTTKDPRQRKEEADARRAEMEADEMERQTSGKWILFASVKSHINGMAAKVCGFFDRAIEDKDGLRRVVREAMARCGATEDLVQTVDAELAKDFVTYNDTLKAECAKTAADAQKHFESERKEQLKGSL